MKHRGASMCTGVIAAVTLVGFLAISPGTSNAAMHMRHGAPFIRSMRFVLHAKRLPTGECAWTLPRLVVRSGEAAKAIRQIGVDDATCTGIFERGVPTVLPPAVRDATNSGSVNAPPPVNCTGTCDGGGPSTKSAHDVVL